MSNPKNDERAEDVKFRLNRIFYFAEEKAIGRLEEIKGPFYSLDEAALVWMLLQIESYTDVMSSRECTNIKVWKSVIFDNEFDVFFHIKAKGRSVPEFDLKTYVVFPKNDKCQFKLEDWADGTRGFINGRVVKSGHTYKCEVEPTQQNPPKQPQRPPIRWDDDQVPL